MIHKHSLSKTYLYLHGLSNNTRKNWGNISSSKQNVYYSLGVEEMQFSGMAHLCHSLCTRLPAQTPPFSTKLKVQFVSNLSYCSPLFLNWWQTSSQLPETAEQQLERLIGMSPLVIRNEQMKVRIKIDWDATTPCPKVVIPVLDESLGVRAEAASIPSLALSFTSCVT